MVCHTCKRTWGYWKHPPCSGDGLQVQKDDIRLIDIHSTNQLTWYRVESLNQWEKIRSPLTNFLIQLTAVPPVTSSLIKLYRTLGFWCAMACAASSKFKRYSIYMMHIAKICACDWNTYVKFQQFISLLVLKHNQVFIFISYDFLCIFASVTVCVLRKIIVQDETKKCQPMFARISLFNVRLCGNMKCRFWGQRHCDHSECINNPHYELTLQNWRFQDE